MARGDGGKDNSHEGHETRSDTGNIFEGTTNRIRYLYIKKSHFSWHLSQVVWSQLEFKVKMRLLICWLQILTVQVKQSHENKEKRKVDIFCYVSLTCATRREKENDLINNTVRIYNCLMSEVFSHLKYLCSMR